MQSEQSPDAYSELSSNYIWIWCWWTLIWKLLIAYKFAIAEEINILNKYVIVICV